MVVLCRCIATRFLNGLFKALDKAKLGLKSDSKAVDKILKQLWAITRTDLPQASQQFEDLELIHRCQSGDAKHSANW
jgi:hypothetical protein